MSDQRNASPFGERPRTPMVKAGFVLIAVFWLGYFGHAFAWTALDPRALEFQHILRRVLAVIGGVALTVTAHAAVMVIGGSYARRGLVALTGAVICCIAFSALNTLIFYVIAPVNEGEAPLMVFRIYVLQMAWVFATWLAAYLSMMAITDLQVEREHAARAEAQAHRARLDMLRYQLNPHFLFNTLNSISTLVLDKRNEEAETVILRLSRFLRHTIDNDSFAKSPLGREVEIQREYLEIEAARFGPRLEVNCAVPESLYDCLTPSLLLQPIVENAIKHVASRSSGVTRLTINADVKGDALVLSVEDDGPGFPDAESPRMGLGLRNTQDRLTTLYGEAGQLRLINRAPNGLRVELELPLERAR
jgi:LytS/YehU family sensor histidine kinase